MQYSEEHLLIARDPRCWEPGLVKSADPQFPAVNYLSEEAVFLFVLLVGSISSMYIFFCQVKNLHKSDGLRNCSWDKLGGKVSWLGKGERQDEADLAGGYIVPRRLVGKGRGFHTSKL